MGLRYQKPLLEVLDIITKLTAELSSEVTTVACVEKVDAFSEHSGSAVITLAFNLDNYKTEVEAAVPSL
jgi:hypothetical protein